MLWAVLFLISSSAFAQKEDFEKVIDYCNCKLTSAYLTKYTSAMQSDKAEKKSYEGIKNKFGKCEIGGSIPYSELSDLLNNNNFKYSNANFSKFINDLKNNFTDNLQKEEAIKKIMSGIFENKNLEGTIKKYINADEMKLQLSKDITAYFEGKFKEKEQVNSKHDDGNNSNEDELNDQITNVVNSRLQDLKPDHWALNYWSIIFLLLGIVIAYVIIKLNGADTKETLKELQQSRQDQRSDINSLKRKVDDLPNSGGGKTVGNFRDDWKNNMEEKISEANMQINKLDVALSMLRGDIDKGSIISNSYSNQPRVDQQPKVEILYASIPSKDGFFNENAISNTINPTASFYKLTIIDALGQKAKFEFLGNDERAVKDATNAPDRILRPACKINNALNQNAKRIKTVSQGTVIKQNGKWIIDILAEIEYE